jgi:beta-1,4-mannosyl-glycoprotein beta-1,4-N-acetylglucosaminyltransferase
MLIDCFTFFNELDLLEIRLKTLDRVVDKFVLVEATFTHQGREKPLYFQENKARFSQFLHKITHIIVNDYPDKLVKLKKPSSWDLERYQRKQIMRGLKNCNPKDSILVSDLDEIPSPDSIISQLEKPGIKIFEHKNFYYFLNCVSCDLSDLWQSGTVLAFYSEFKSTQDLRMLSIKFRGENSSLLKDKTFRFFKSFSNSIFRKHISIVENAGWHFSFLGGADRIIEKLEAFAHREFNKEEFKNKAAVLDAINSGKDLFGRGLKYEYVPIDDSYPQYIVSNQERFSHLIK